MAKIITSEEIKRELSDMEKLRDLPTITHTPFFLTVLISQQSSLESVSPSRLLCSSPRAANFSFLDEQ